MYFDSLGKTPSEYDELRPDARCPECHSNLYKRGGGHMKCIEHWAHYPDPNRDCFAESVSSEESEWHLLSKKCFRDQGFEVEKTVECNGNKYRLDAVLGKHVFEFVNTYSAKYEQKAIDLIECGYDLHWILNGETRFAERSCFLSFSGSAKRFVARMENLGCSTWVMVHGNIVKINDGKVKAKFGLFSITNPERFVYYVKKRYRYWTIEKIDKDQGNDLFYNWSFKA
jgi:hypothetical protein